MKQSLSERALSEIECRLKRIRLGDDYSTDAGKTVRRAARSFDTSECPAIAVWDQGESVQNGGGSSDAYTVTLRVGVIIHVVADQDDTGCEIECAKADVKRAVLSGSKGSLADGPPPDTSHRIGTIAYTGCDVTPREQGSVTEYLLMSFEVVYREGYGNPYSAQIEATT